MPWRLPLFLRANSSRSPLRGFRTRPVIAIERSGRQIVIGLGSVGAGLRLEIVKDLLRSGRPLGRLRGHSGGIQGIALSSDGQRVATGSYDGTVRLWETRSGQLRTTFTGHIGAIWDLTMSEDGQLIASRGYDGTIRLWDTSTGELRSTLHGHTGVMRGVALNRVGPAHRLVVESARDHGASSG